MAEKKDIRAPAEVAIEEIPIERIDPFPDHPYKVADDADMDQLVESIRAKGIITPCTVRKIKGGRYELIAGHRRMHACKKLGLKTLRCEVRDLSKDEATVLMVESNFQRDRLLPSEKAFAYKMRLEAMKMQISRMRENQKQGRKYGGEPGEPQLENASEHLEKSYGLEADEISRIGNAESRRHGHGAPVGPESRRARDQLAAVSPDGREQIRRYIRLTELIPELLELVDEGKIGLRTAVEISYLGHFQRDVFESIKMEESYPTQAQAIRMRRMCEQGKLTSQKIQEIMLEAKPNQKERFSMSSEKIMKLLPDNLSRKQTERYVEAALEHYARYLERKERDCER